MALTMLHQVRHAATLEAERNAAQQEASALRKQLGGGGAGGAAGSTAAAAQLEDALKHVARLQAQLKVCMGDRVQVRSQVTPVAGAGQNVQVKG